MNIFVFETTPCKNSGYLRAFSLKLFSHCGISWLFWSNNYHENKERKNAIYPYNKVSTSFKVLLQNCSLAHSDGTSGSRSFLSFVKQYLLVRLNYLLITQTLNFLRLSSLWLSWLWLPFHVSLIGCLHRGWKFPFFFPEGYKMLCRDFEAQINLCKVKEKASELRDGHDIHVSGSFEVFENIGMRSM